MIFVPTPLAGAFVVELETRVDDRGFFARTFSVDELRAHGLRGDMVEGSISHSARRGTLRGMHFQAEPFAEAKLVSCVAGAIHDVIVDLRRGSPTFGETFATELDTRARRSLFIPEGLAHGFQTLTSDAVVAYLMNQRYHPDAARGVRWDDPALGIDWPVPAPTLSPRDRGLPTLTELLG